MAKYFVVCCTHNEDEGQYIAEWTAKTLSEVRCAQDAPVASFRDQGRGRRVRRGSRSDGVGVMAENFICPVCGEPARYDDRGLLVPHTDVAEQSLEVVEQQQYACRVNRRMRVDHDDYTHLWSV